jgi:hypothetical protein
MSPTLSAATMGQTNPSALALATERERPAADLDVNDGARAGRGVEVHQLARARAAEGLLAADAFDQHFLDAAGKLLVDLERDARLDLLDAVEAGCLHVSRDVVLHAAGGRWGRRVGRDVNLSNRNSSRSARFFELGLGPPG